MDIVKQLRGMGGIHAEVWNLAADEIIKLRGGLERTNIKLREMTEQCFDAVRVRNEAISENNTTRWQRDELVAALQKIKRYPRVSGDEIGYAGCRVIARDILAKVGADGTAPEGHNDQGKGQTPQADVPLDPPCWAGRRLR